ncbi:MAG: SDR family NAD(P)-dependent oxidoreductase [Smithella sp.]
MENFSYNPFSLSGKNILVTGASSGIGEAVSVLASKMGAKCILCGRNIERLEKTISKMEGNGHLFFCIDLTQNTQENILTDALTQTEKLDGFVHCAGIEKTLPFRDTEISEYHEISAINFDAFWNISREFIRKGKYSKEKFSVVAISSIVGLCGAAGKTAYAASKGALISLVKSLAAEYAPRRLRFNCVCPGYVDTPMLDNLRELYPNQEEFEKQILKQHPLGLGQTEDIASAVIFLLSDASRWITGTTLIVDGGYSIR